MSILSRSSARAILRFVAPDFDRSDVIRALAATNYNVSQAAKALRTTRKTLQARMRAYGMPFGRPGVRKKPLRYRSRASRLVTGLGVAAAAVGAVALGLKFRRNSSA